MKLACRFKSFTRSHLFALSLQVLMEYGVLSSSCQEVAIPSWFGIPERHSKIMSALAATETLCLYLRHLEIAAQFGRSEKLSAEASLTSTGPG
jgi:hypothetical protein